MAKRSARADFRITDEEDKHLRQASVDAGYAKFSEYLRALTLERTILAVGADQLVVIPAASTSIEDDKRIEARIAALVEAANGQAQGAPAPDQPPVAPAPAPVVPPPAHPEPAPSSPREPDGTVGASPPDEAPAAPPPSLPAADSLPAAGSQPGSAETSSVPPSPGAPAGPTPPAQGICPHCGGREGQHQSFCETITGESPVTAPAVAAGVETHEQFVARRVSEGEISAVAEAEWRQLATGPVPDPAPVAAPAAAAPPPAALAPCSSCGTMKNPAAQCRECGRRPDTYA